MRKVGVYGGGIGGFDQVLRQIEVKCRFSFIVESDSSCRKIYKKNSNQSRKLFDSIESINTKDNSIDILLASCSKKEDYSNIIELISRFKPKFIAVENPISIDYKINSSTKKNLGIFLRNNNFKLAWVVLDTSIHGGIPHNKKKVFLIASTSGIPRYEYQTIPHHFKASELVNFNGESEECYYLKNQFNFTNLEKNKFYSLRGDYILCSPNDNCYSIYSSDKLGGLPCIRDSKGVRRITERECLLLMGLRSSLKLSNSKTINYGCISKSIVPSLFQNILNNNIDKL